MTKENRNTDRIKTDYSVKMSRSGSMSNRVFEAKIINISQGGCKLKMENIQTGFAVGELIHVSFKMSEFNQPGNAVLKLDGEVRWAYPDGSEIGCQFKPMDPKQQELFQYILKFSPK